MIKGIRECKKKKRGTLYTEYFEFGIFIYQESSIRSGTWLKSIAGHF